jgi:hypothetical protein
MKLTFTPADWSGTLAWDAVNGADSYDIYLKYIDSIRNFKCVAENIADTSFKLGLDYARHAEFYVTAKKDGTVIAESEHITGKSNGIRANDTMVRDDKLRYYMPKMTHMLGSLFTANGEIWICDSGLSKGGQELDNYLMELRRQAAEQLGIDEADESLKIAANAHLSHYHSDHIAGMFKIMMKNPFIAFEKIYISTPETDPEMRHFTGNNVTWLKAVDEYLPGKSTYYYEVPWGKHIRLELENIEAVLDLYPAYEDHTTIYLKEDGSPDYSRGYWNIVALRDEAHAKVLAQNYNSTWTVIRYGKNSIFITADYSGFDDTCLTPTLNYYGRENFENVDILTYPHHGVARFSPLLSDVANAKYTVFMGGLEEMLGQPRSVLALRYCEKSGSKLLWTDQAAFTATLDGKTVTIDREPDEWPDTSAVDVAPQPVFFSELKQYQ